MIKDIFKNMKTEKKCARCGETKDVDLFRNESRGKLQKKNYCIECDDEYNRAHYAKNKEKRIKQVLERRRIQKQRELGVE